MSIGANIRRIREEKGLKQVELAKMANVTQAMICQIERGTKPPSLPLSVDITKVLECSIDDLVEER